MKTKLFEATLLIECEQEATNYIAQSVCDGLELDTAVKHIHIKEYKEPVKVFKNFESTERVENLLNKVSEFLANGEPKSAEILLKQVIFNYDYFTK